MDSLQRYHFDTFGFVVLRNVLSAAEVTAMNIGISHNQHNFHERTGSIRNSAQGTSGRRDCGNFLSWPASDAGDTFRSLICHPVLFPILNEVCGLGHRLDHKPLLFSQPMGAEGFDLHGGAVRSDGSINFPISYHCLNGQILCSLVNVAVQLSDSPSGSGGFVVIPGSHKSNFPPPTEGLRLLTESHGYQPECNAGDVVLFTEAVLHGATVRSAPEERRVVLMRFAPATCAYARGYLEQDFLEHLTPVQRAVAGPPFHLDQDRLIPGEGEAVCIPRPRKEEKKDFDRLVFKSDYY